MARPKPLKMNGFIGPGMEVNGTVRFRNLLRVDGLLKGRVESFDTLVIGKGGRVEAEVIVGSMQVYGEVSGKIAVDGKVEIFPGARVEGELYASAPSVKISEGGVFEGELIMVPTAAAEAGNRRVPGDAEAPSTATPKQGQDP